jgi:hypothetical protein
MKMKKITWFSFITLSATISMGLLMTCTSSQDQLIVKGTGMEENEILSDPLYVLPLKPGGSAWLSGPYSTLNKNFQVLHPFQGSWPYEHLQMTDIAMPVPTWCGTALRYVLGGDSFGDPENDIINSCNQYPYHYWNFPYIGNSLFIQAKVNKDDLGYILSVEFSGNETNEGWANIMELSDDEKDFNDTHPNPGNDPQHPENWCMLSVYPLDYFYYGNILYVITATVCWGRGCTTSCWDDASQNIGTGLYEHHGMEGLNKRIKYHLYENDEILWGPETHFSYVAAIRNVPFGSNWVCFMGAQRPREFPRDPEPPADWDAMMACVDKSDIADPRAYNYWVGPETNCHFAQSSSGRAPAEVDCPVATADHLSPISIEKYKGYWRLIYAAIYATDEERYAYYNGAQYEAVKIWKTSDIFKWTNSPEYRQVHPLINLPGNSDVFSFHFAPHWYPPSVYSGPDFMYFNTSIWLKCAGNGEEALKIRYDTAHYQYWVP